MGSSIDQARERSDFPKWRGAAGTRFPGRYAFAKVRTRCVAFMPTTSSAISER
jgi:hypothetical protein